MFKNKLIRFFCIPLCILFTGCSVKQPATESKPPEATQPPGLENPDDFEHEDSYLNAGGFGDSIEICDEYVKLDYSIILSRKKIECTVLAFQNGAAVPFSFEPDGDYSLSHRKTFPTREQNGSIYIKAADFHQGDSVSFDMGFVCNSDFMPEIEKSPHYGREQMINHYAKAYTASRDFSSNTVINILTDVDWEAYPDITYHYTDQRILLYQRILYMLFLYFFTSQGQKSTVRGQCIDFISSFRHIVCIIFSYTRKSFNIPQEGEMFLL